METMLRKHEKSFKNLENGPQACIEFSALFNKQLNHLLEFVE